MMTASLPDVRRRRLIVNADDFGQSEGINDGVIECYEHGVLTSASLMVRWPSALAAAEYARAAPALSVGLHVDLGEWAFERGEWRPLYVVVARDNASAVRAEIERQLETFRRLLGCLPTHIDSHQHVHNHEPVRSVVAEIGGRLGVPIRASSGRVAYEGTFYGQGRTGGVIDGGVTVEHLVGILRGLPEGTTTELGCHPGLGNDAPGIYVAERGQEAHVLCDPRVRSAIQAEDIDLISFRELTRGD